MTNTVTMKPLKVGVVGCGMMACGTHLPNIVRNPLLTLEWACDSDAARARSAGKEFGAARLTADYQDVLRDPAVDFVLLATTHSLRVEFIEAAVRHKKPVYVEKPMAGSAAEVEQVLRLVRESGLPFCVGHNRRSAPAVKDALAVLDRLDAHHPVVPWRLDRNSDLRPPMPEEAQRMVLIRINDDVLSWKPWAFAEGAIINEMTHFVDLANLFMGRRQPCQVAVMGSERMNFTLLIRYGDGSIATLAHSAVGTLDYPKELIEITCHGAMVAIDHLMEVRVMGIEGEPFRRTYPSPDPQARTRETGIAAFYESTQQTVEERLKLRSNELFIGGPNKGHYAHLDQFARCVRGVDESPCDAEDGAQSTLLTLTALDACRQGTTLPFGTERNRRP